MIQQAYGRESLSEAQVFRWHKMFKEAGRGHPSTSGTAENEQRVRHLLNTDRRLSVRMIAEQLGMDKMYDPETKCQSNEWHTPQSPRQKKARMSKSRMKTMLINFFDKNGVVHSEFDPEGQTVNGVFYVEVLKDLSDGSTREIRNFRQLEAPPRQCAISHLLRSYRVLDKKWHRNNFHSRPIAPTLSQQTFSLPQSENRPPSAPPWDPG
ncbi:HTH_48 domain-containing protein [Trichonephila clavipes]|nr:HTH_48 domain-containing protein [Trichonephila clavipes]